jgi:DNA repair protein SbcD/Mre11
VKILHTSDWHVGRSIRGRSRAAEHRAVLAEIAGIAADHAVDLVTVAGDLFDVAAPTPESERIVYRALLDLSEIAPVIVVAGNHDNPRRLQAVAPLLRLGRVRVAATVSRPAEGGVVDDLGLPVRVALLPWQSQRGIVSAADLMAKDAMDNAADYGGRMGRIVAALCAGMTTDTVNLAVGHMSLFGAARGGSERQSHIFGYAVAAQCFPGHLSYVALGHFHRRQRVPGPAPIWYSGSPLQLDFGESEDDKGVIVVEAEPGTPASTTPVPIRGGRRLLRLAGTLDEVVEAAAGAGDAYLKVEIDEPARAGLAEEVRDRLPDVVDVSLAPARRDVQDLAPTARLGRDPRDLFVEYLEGRGAADDRVVALFDELMEDAHAT